MQEEHRLAIKRNFGSLVNTTDLDTMVSALYEKNLLTAHMMEYYNDSSLSQIQRKRRLYIDIVRRGPNAFEGLLEALEEHGYWDLVRMLDPNSILNSAKSSSKSNDEENKFVSLRDARNKTEMETKNNNAPTDSAQPTNEDNNNAMATFTVIKSTKFQEDDERNDIGRVYRTRGRRRGIMLVFSYSEFLHGSDTYRGGVDVDCDNLKDVFSQIGFNVICYKDLSKKETVSTLSSLREVLVRTETVFVVVSSHGYERGADTDVRCGDGGLIPVKEILSYFSNRHLPDLVHIPKVFIFQICRGASTEYMEWGGYAPPHLPMPDADTEPDGAPLPPDEPPPAPRPRHRPPTKMALYNNILIVQSTLPGFVSYRDTARGSWYIRVACEVFAERAHECDVDTLFTLVDARLQARYRVQTSSVDRWGFNKKLFLHPGLFE